MNSFVFLLFKFSHLCLKFQGVKFLFFFPKSYPFSHIFMQNLLCPPFLLVQNAVFDNNLSSAVK